MKTPALLAMVAIGAVVAVGGLAVASGPVSSALSQGGDSSHHQGMMGQSGGGDGCGSCWQVQRQCGYQYQLSGPQQNATFQHCMQSEYSWSYGDSAGCVSDCGCSCQVHDWNYDWNYSYEHQGPCMD